MARVSKINTFRIKMSNNNEIIVNLTIVPLASFLYQFNIIILFCMVERNVSDEFIYIFYNGGCRRNQVTEFIQYYEIRTTNLKVHFENFSYVENQCF